MKQKILALIFILVFSLQSFGQAIAYQAPNMIQCNLEVFNLTTQNAIILGNQNPSQFEINYFLTLSGAVNNTSPIANPTFFVAPQSQSIFARVTNLEDNSFATTSFLVQWNTFNLAPQPSVSVCDFYVLPPLTTPNANYYTGPNGIGVVLPVGTAITITSTIFIYATNGTCTDETSFIVIVNPSPVIQPQNDVYVCSSYVLPALQSPFSAYYTLPGGPTTFGTIERFPGDVITSSQTLYVYATSGGVPSCVSENSFTIIIDQGGVFEQPLPELLYLCENQNLTLFYPVQNTGASYQWFFEGIALAGENYPNLIINQIGNYSCVVNFLCGESVTSATQVELNPSCTNNTITGTIHFDYDNNGCTTNDIASANIQVVNTNGNQVQYAYTNSSGNYAFLNVAEGTNTVTIQSGLPNDYNLVTPVSQNFSFIGTENTATADFCLTAANPVSDAVIYFYSNGNARPGFDISYTMYVYNNGNTILNGATSVNYDGSKLDFIGTSPAFNTQNGTNLVFNFNNLMPFAYQTYYLFFNVKTPPLVNSGDILSFDATIETSQTDTNPLDNSFNFNQIVVNSFDPNDIAVQQGPEILQNQVDDYLNYTIRFQNTGTAEAINVKLENELDALLDWFTFRPIASSHNYTVDRTNNKVTFRFNGINLPASSVDEVGSNGYITYKIKPNADLVIGDIISNVADIYFDFNLPITTNTVTTELVNVLNLKDNSFEDFSMYPNPASDKITLQFAATLENVSISIYDLQGKKIVNSKVSPRGNAIVFDVSKIQPGMYFVKIVSGNQSAVRKLIVN